MSKAFTSLVLLLALCACSPSTPAVLASAPVSSPVEMRRVQSEVSALIGRVPSKPASSAVQCSALTKKGAQCSKRTTKPSGLCGVHAPKSSEPVMIDSPEAHALGFGSASSGDCPSTVR